MRILKKLFSPRDMTEGAPWKNLLIFTVPMLIGNIIQQLYSTVDAVVVGHYAGDNALAAVGSTMAIFNLLLVLFIGISSGTGIMVSQYFGAKKREELSFTIGNCLTILAIVSLVIMIFAPLGTRPLLRLLKTPEAILDSSASYINILLRGVLGVGYYNILTGILRGMGDSFSPLLYLGVACTLNIVLDLLFVAVFGWGVSGAAAATVISQFVSGILCVRQLMKMRGVFDMGKKYLIPSKKYVRQVVGLGLPTGASQAVFSMAMMMVQSLINGFGESFIASNTIVMRIDGFVIMPIFSFANAVMVFTGQNIGAGKLERVRQGTRQCAIMSIVTAIVIVTLISVFGRSVARMFTGTEEIIELSVRLLRILALGYVSLSYSQVLWGVIRGAGDTMTPMWASLIITVATRVPIAHLLVHLLKIPEAIYYSTLFTWLLSTAFAFLSYRFGKWRTKGIVNTNRLSEST